MIVLRIRLVLQGFDKEAERADVLRYLFKFFLFRYYITAFSRKTLQCAARMFDHTHGVALLLDCQCALNLMQHLFDLG